MAEKKPLRNRINNFIETPIIFLMAPVGFILLLLTASFLFEDPKPAHSGSTHLMSDGAAHITSQGEIHDADDGHSDSGS